MFSEKYNDLLLSNNYKNDRLKGIYEDNKSSVSYEDFIQLLEYNLIGKTAHIKESIEKIKEFKILNKPLKKDSSNTIRLRLNLNPKVEIETKSFKSLDNFEGLNSWKVNKLTNIDQISEYETTITSSDFDHYKVNLSKHNITDSNQAGINNHKNKSIKNKNNCNAINNNSKYPNDNEKRSKYGHDKYVRENSDKIYNDYLIKQFKTNNQ